MADEISIEVAFATSLQQTIVPISVATECTVQQAIEKSDILEQHPEIDLQTMAVGVFAKICSLASLVNQGDRIEIYRPLFQDPMVARRNRAKK